MHRSMFATIKFFIERPTVLQYINPKYHFHIKCKFSSKPYFCYYLEMNSTSELKYSQNVQGANAHDEICMIREGLELLLSITKHGISN